MKQQNGFTLIELLVVVLIIGILAAIALPQYQKAVLKSRYSSLMPTAKAILDGQEIYYLTNSNYANNLANLEVTVASSPKTNITLGNDTDYKYVKATRDDIKNNYIMYQKHSPKFPGEIHCEAETGNTQAQWLCESALKGMPISGSISGGNYKTYVLTGQGTDTFSNSSSDAGTLTLAAFLTTSYCTTNGFTCSVDTENELVRRCPQAGACEEYILALDHNGNPVYQRCNYGENDGMCSIGEGRYETIINADGQEQSKTCNGFSSETDTCAEHDTDWVSYDDSGNMISTEHRDCADCLGENYTYVEKYTYSYDDDGNPLEMTGYNMSCGGSVNCLDNINGNVGMVILYNSDDGNGGGSQVEVQCDDGENGACTYWRVDNHTTGDSYACARWNIAGGYCEEVLED